MGSYESILKIYKGVPLFPNSGHTVWFRGNLAYDPATAIEVTNKIKQRQASWFEQYKFTEFNDMSYQRISEGIADVKINADQIYDANYISIKNEEGHIYYAFLNKVEYINERTSRLYYELDGLQCFQESIEFIQCFVERSHESKDYIGRNTVPEGLEIGAYLRVNKRKDGAIPEFNPHWDPDKQEINFQKWVVVVGTVSQNGSTFIGNKPSALHLQTFSKKSTLDSFLKNFENPDNIICAYMFPKDWIVEVPTTPGVIPKAMSWTGQYKMQKSFDDYVPRNKKLFQYPYNFIEVANHEGNTMQYRFEQAKFEPAGEYNFENVEIWFDYYVTCSMAPGSKFLFVPHYPYDDNSHTPKDMGYWETGALTGGTLPNVPIAGDAFKAWYAQNQASLDVSNMAVTTNALQSVVGTLAGVAGGFSLGGPAGAGVAVGSAVGGLANTAVSAFMNAKSNNAKITDAKAVGDYVKGSVSAESQWAVGNFGFTITQVQIIPEIAKQIDSFFDRFGYQLNEVARPRPLNRPRYYYFKTSEPCVKMFDQINVYGIPPFVFETWNRNAMNGLTLWHYNKIGDRVNSTMYDYSGNEV